MPEEVLEDLMIEVANQGNQANQGMPGQMPGLNAFDDDVEDIAPPAELAIRQEHDHDEDEDIEDEEEEEEIEAAVSACLSVSSGAVLNTSMPALAGPPASQCHESPLGWWRKRRRRII